MKNKILLHTIGLFLVFGLFFMPGIAHAAYITYFLNSPKNGDQYCAGQTATVSGTITNTACSNNFASIPLNIYVGSTYIGNTYMNIIGGGTASWSATYTIPANAPNGASYIETKWSIALHDKTTGNLVETDGADTKTPVSIGPGICGTASGTVRAAKPTGNFCTIGTASAVSGSGPWSWTCTTSCGSVNCSAALKGTCGSADGSNFYNKPTTNLCATGTATAVSGTGPWTWKCNGSNGGANDSCTTSSAGTCGTANGVTVLTQPTSNLCTKGTSSLSGSGPWSWTCTTTCGSAICSAPIQGTCGTSSGGSFSSAPTTNLCATGITGTVVGKPILGGGYSTSGPWSWTCSDSPGSSNFPGYVNCTALVTGICGTAARTYLDSSFFIGSMCVGIAMTNPPTSLSTPANPVFPTITSPVTTWTCADPGGGGSSPPCIATLERSGSCGTASKTYSACSTGFGTDTQCSFGTPSSIIFPSAGSSATWICSGFNGGPASGTCTATNPAGTNGACGTAAVIYAAGATSFSGTFCNTGNPNPASPVFPSGGHSVTWRCKSPDCGSDSDNCTATNSAVPVNGACGSTNGGSFTTTPTTNLCATGTLLTPPGVTGSGPWSWTCSGSNGGTNAICSAFLLGSCGTANNHSYPACSSSFGTYTQCSTGTPSSTTFPTYGSSTTWICYGSVGGASSGTCTATNPAGTNGACGTANGHVYPAGSSSFGTYTQCGTGTPSSTTFPTSGHSTSWTCSSPNCGSASGNCTATNSALPANGACGTANNHIYPACSSNFGTYTQCSSGNPSSTTFPTAGNSASWTCSGINGGSTSGTCVATNTAGTNGVCGTAATTYAVGATSFSGTLCNPGASSPASPVFPAAGSSVTWKCSSPNCGSVSGNCTAVNPAIPINGTCGSANGVAVSLKPTSGFCTTGTASAVSGTGPWKWSCSSTNGGSTANCSAPKMPSASSLQVGETDCNNIAYTSSIFLSWIYVDTNTPSSPELKFDLQVSDHSDFSSIISNSQQLYVVENPIPAEPQIAFNKTYWWRVRVYNTLGAISDWINGPSFITAPHSYPTPSISFSPAPFSVGQNIYFSGSATTGDNEIPTYTWTFDDGSQSTSQNPASARVYNNQGVYNETLTACDHTQPTPECCTVSKKLQVIDTSSLPIWKEISPF